MNILEKITEHKYEEVAARKRKVKVSALCDMEFFDRQTLSLIDALNRNNKFSIIAEFKRSSPMAADLRKNAIAEDVAREYEANGASAISVLTDERFFSGSLDDLRLVRHTVNLPILRKDFIIDEYQLYEAKSHGADAVLLIAALLETSQMRNLHTAAKELGLEALVELYKESELDMVDLDQMKLIGINNRDLRTFEVDLNQTITMAGQIPKDVTIVSESGIHTADDLRRLHAAGVRAALIGEYFMKAEHPGKALQELLEGMHS